MIYAENLFMCLAAPMLVAVFFLKGEARRIFSFTIVGLAACLLSAYINSFLATATANLSYGSLSAAEAVIRLTPVCEEVMKAMPVFFYIAVLGPPKRAVPPTALAVGLGFATMENVCYLATYDAGDVLFVLIRGFSAGVMHAICAAVLGHGLAFVMSRRYLLVPGAFGLLCAATTIHAIYNLLVSVPGMPQVVGYVLPVATSAVLLVFLHRPRFCGGKE